MIRKQNLNVSHLGITSGIRQERSDFVASASGQKLHARRGQLWMLVEPASDSGGASAAAKLVMEAIEDAYYDSDAPSITTALEDAIAAGNRLLYEYNSGAPAHRQAYLGVTCVALTGREAYLAQVQPSQCLIVHQGTLRSVPDTPARQEADLVPLGLEADVEMDFARTPFDTGDVIILMTGALASLAGGEDEQALTYEDSGSAAERLHRLAARANLLDAHAVVIERPARAERQPGMLASRLRRGVMGSRIGSLRMPGRNPLGGALVGQRAARFGGGVLRGSHQLTAGRLRLASALVGALVLFVLVGGLGARAYQGYQRNTRFDSLISTAELHRQAARGKPTQEARQQLQAARKSVEDAQKIYPDNPKVGAMLSGIAADWDIVNRVVQLPSMTALTALEGYKPGDASKLIVVENRALILLRSTGKVYSYDLKRSKGAFLAPRQSARMVGLSWREGGAVMLDAGGRVYDYDFKSGNWTSIKLGGGRKWSAVTGFDSYGTRLYITIRGTSGVIRYDTRTPGKGSLVRIAGPKGSFAVSSLSSDGNVWVTNSVDSSIWKFVDGKLRQKVWIEADPRVDGAYGLVVTDANQYLYLLDSWRDRVIQANTGGELVAQLRLPKAVLAGGRVDAVYAEESASKLYVVAGGKLYTAALPPAR